jgi:hypothetical protein
MAVIGPGNEARGEGATPSPPPPLPPRPVLGRPHLTPQVQSFLSTLCGDTEIAQLELKVGQGRLPGLCDPPTAAAATRKTRQAVAPRRRPARAPLAPPPGRRRLLRARSRAVRNSGSSRPLPALPLPQMGTFTIKVRRSVDGGAEAHAAAAAPAAATAAPAAATPAALSYTVTTAEGPGMAYESVDEGVVYVTSPKVPRAGGDEGWAAARAGERREEMLPRWSRSCGRGSRSVSQCQQVQQAAAAAGHCRGGGLRSAQGPGADPCMISFRYGRSASSAAASTPPASASARATCSRRCGGREPAARCLCSAVCPYPSMWPLAATPPCRGLM